MKRKQPPNDICVWLMDKFDCQDTNKEMQFENSLTEIDEKQKTDFEITIVYQAICTNIIIEGNTYKTYGIQMLSCKSGNYFIADEIQDITTNAEQIWQLVNLLNDEKVADVHFRDVVIDSIL